MKLFYLFIFIFSTTLFGVDKTYKASSGNLILDASTKVIAKPDVDIGDSSVVGNRYFTVKADAANRPYLQLNSGSNTIQYSIGSTADISSPQVELHMSVLGSDNTLVLEGGEVGINTPNPAADLHIVGDSSSDHAEVLKLNSSSASYGSFISYHADGIGNVIKLTGSRNGSDGRFWIDVTDSSATFRRMLSIHPADKGTWIGHSTAPMVKTSDSRHIDDYICTTGIAGSSTENIFSITFSNTANHSGAARVSIMSSGETGGTNFGGGAREWLITWRQGSAMNVQQVHSIGGAGSQPNVSTTVSTNVVTFVANAGTALSHYCHAIEVRGVTGVYGSNTITYTRYGD